MTSSTTTREQKTERKKISEADLESFDCDEVFLVESVDSKKSFDNTLNFEEMSNCLINLMDNDDYKGMKNFDHLIDYNNQCDFSFFQFYFYEYLNVNSYVSKNFHVQRIFEELLKYENLNLRSQNLDN